MKAILKHINALILSGFVGWLSTGCANNGSNEAMPNAQCRIQQYVGTSRSASSIGNRQTTYEYDAQGNLLKTVTTTTGQPANGGVINSRGTTTDTYAYDADGYLATSTKRIQTSSTINGKTTEEVTSNTNSYSYTGGRLAGYTMTYTNGQGATTTAAYTYTYDNAGELTQIVNSNPANPGGLSSIWVYRNNRLVDYVEKLGTAERRPVTIENGLVTRMTLSGSNELFLTAQFDSQQRMTKREEYKDGQLDRYETQTWADAKPSDEAVPKFKGFPTIDPASPYSGRVGVLASRATFYWNAVSKTIQPFNQSTSTVQTNAQGYVTNVATVVTYANPNGAPSETVTETFTYAGCQ